MEIVRNGGFQLSTLFACSRQQPVFFNFKSVIMRVRDRFFVKLRKRRHSLSSFSTSIICSLSAHFGKHMRKQVSAVVLVVLASMTAGSQARAGEPGWSPVVIATGDYRRQLESTPILHRPYRPLHFYGNTLRRLHYRGNPLPIPRFMSDRVRWINRRGE